MKPTGKKQRRGFATIEIFIATPAMLAVGIGATFLVRWLASTTHWTTWIPAVAFGIPFFIVYGLLIPTVLYAAVCALINKRFRRS